MPFYEMPKPWWINDSSDYLRLTIISRRLLDQTGNVRSDSSIKTDAEELNAERYTWSFIAPNEIQESIAHEWGEYENISSRIANKIASSKHAWENISDIAEGVKEGIMSKKAGTTLNNILNGVHVPRYKIDTPLMYQNSKRLEYSLSFTLVYTGTGIIGNENSLSNEVMSKMKDVANNEYNKLYKTGRSKISNMVTQARTKAANATRITGQIAADANIDQFAIQQAGIPTESYTLGIKPLEDFIRGDETNQDKFAQDIFDKLYNPITILERQTCAEMTDDIAGIEFPNIFRIYTSPAKIINIKQAAITAVQPTWKAPYIKGLPLQCELQITFTDLNPLYKRRVDEKLKRK